MTCISNEIIIIYGGYEICHHTDKSIVTAKSILMWTVIKKEKEEKKQIMKICGGSISLTSSSVIDSN